MSFLFSSCVTDTINKFETFTVQIPIYFKADHVGKGIPDTSLDFTNLYKYDEYNSNKNKINKAEIYQLNYRIDSLIKEDSTVYNPNIDDLEFEFVSFKLKFAKPKPGKNEYSLDSADFEKDDTEPLYILGEYQNVKVKDFYKKAKNIIQVPEANAKAISDLLKTRPYFYIEAQYSKLKGQDKPKIKFPFIRARYDLVVRLEIKL